MILSSEEVLKHSETSSGFSYDWKKELKKNIRNVDQLKQYINLDAKEEEDIRRVVEQHPMNILKYYLNLIDRDDPNDPIRKLAIPTSDELIIAGQMGETTTDPYGDDKHNKGNGILHK